MDEETMNELDKLADGLSNGTVKAVLGTNSKLFIDGKEVACIEDLIKPQQ